MKTALVPYLYFNGQAREAMEFYKSIFDGELTLQTFGSAGYGDESMKEKIMHGELKTDSFSFMTSDGMGQEIKMGNNVHLTLTGADENKLIEYFNKLAEGGTVDMKLEKQFWGDIYGQLTDKYGIHWEINISQEGQSNA